MDNLTVVIPAYNSAKYLGAAIESARRAHGCSLNRIIVVDDGSHDETSQVATEAGVVCIRHPSNRGIASGLNTAIAASSTEYVAWLSSDDEYVDEAGGVLAEAMKKVPGADLYFGCFRQIDSRGVLSDVMGRPGLVPAPSGVALGDIFVDLLFGCYINGSTTVMKRQRMIELGLFDGKFPYSQDYFMWLLMTYHRSSAVFMNEVVGLRRVHERQLSWNPKIRKAIIRENSRLISGYLTANTLERVERRIGDLGLNRDEHMTLLAKRCLQLRMYAEAFRLISLTSDRFQSVRTLGSDIVGFGYRSVKRWGVSKGFLSFGK